MADTSATINDLVAQRQLQYATPALYPAIQRSAYLADALDQMRKHGGENIRTGGALASNLLAEAIEQFAARRASQDVNTQLQGGMTDRLNTLTEGFLPSLPTAPQAAPGNDGGGLLGRLFHGLTGGGTAPTAAASTGPAPAASYDLTPQAVEHMQPAGAVQAGINNPPPPPAPPQAAPTAHPLANILDPRDEDAAVRTVWGEARGEGVPGQQAVAGVIANRAHMTGQSLADIVSAPHQFAGYSARARSLDPNSPEYQSIKQAIDPVLMGEVVSPAGNADHFYAPQGMPGGRPPSWDNGTGHTIGHQNFLSLGFGGRPPMAAPQGAPGTPMPLQTTTGGDVARGPGPTPSGTPDIPGLMPMPTVSMPGTQPASLTGGSGAPNPPVPQMPAGTSQGQGGQPGLGQPGWRADVVPPTQQQLAELARLRDLAARYPDQYMGALQQFAGSLRQQASTPEEIQISPSEGGQMIVVGKTSGRVYGVQTAAGWQPGPESGFTNGPNGSEVVRPGGSKDPNAPQNRVGPPGVIPGTETVGQQDATGRYTANAPAAFNQSIRTQLYDRVAKSEEYKNYTEAAAAFRAMTSAAQSTGGMFSYAMLDTFARAINPGAVARVGTIQAIKEAQGLPDALKGALLSLTANGQFLSPEMTRQILQVTRNFVQSRQAVLAPLLHDNEDLARRNGLDPRDVTPSIAPFEDAPAVPGQTAPGGHGRTEYRPYTGAPPTQADIDRLAAGPMANVNGKPMWRWFDDTFGPGATEHVLRERQQHR